MSATRSARAGAAATAMLAGPLLAGPLLAGLLLTSGCALLSKADPREPRYFTPESPGHPAPDGAADKQPDSGLELRLGHISGQEYLRDKIVHRDSPFEVGYYDGRVWTEKPERYVRREIARAIFDERGIKQVVSGAGSTLDVDVVAFEEVMAPEHVGRVELSYALYDDRCVLFSRTVRVERPIADKKGDAAANAAVSAIAEALDAAVQQVADATAGELRSEAAANKAAPMPAVPAQGKPGPVSSAR